MIFDARLYHELSTISWKPTEAAWAAAAYAALDPPGQASGLMTIIMISCYALLLLLVVLLCY